MKKNILIVDDEPSIRDTLQRTLRNLRDGCVFFTAGNGVEALKLMQSTPIDLIITDLLMPEKEGLETIMEVRKCFPAVKIIAISGGGRNGTIDFLDVAEKLGASYTLSKPFTPEEIREVVQEVLNGLE
ncbi:MAG: response regulator [Proteobacteria bacterium]|nr:response regulator [Pseudomonadota bacterium]